MKGTPAVAGGRVSLLLLLSEGEHNKLERVIFDLQRLEIRGVGTVAI